MKAAPIGQEPSLVYKTPGECATNHSAFSMELEQLEKFTNYCVHVVGVTSKGFGRVGDCFYVMTDEDGE